MVVPVHPFALVCLLGLLAVACRPALDDPAATLAVPKSLPSFQMERPAVGVAQRAAALVGEGMVVLDQGDLRKAIPLLTEALATDPANTDARLQLARAFVRGGRSSVAVQLLEPARKQLKACGTCVELLQSVVKSPDFAHLRETSAGRDLLRDVPAAPLPYPIWARKVAKALQTTDLATLVGNIDSVQAFDLVRSCPTCQNIGARAETRRPLVGMAPAAKIAIRFDLTHPEARGLPLLTPGDPQCKDRCCQWNLPQPMPVGQVGMRRICFWPKSPGQGTVTELAFEYGATAQ